MSNQPAPLPPRHALGLPAGSVRALLALSVLALLWLLALQPMRGHAEALGAVKLPTVFMDLQILMVLTILMYATTSASPLFTPPSFRLPMPRPKTPIRDYRERSERRSSRPGQPSSAAVRSLAIAGLPGENR